MKMGYCLSSVDAKYSRIRLICVAGIYSRIRLICVASASGVVKHSRSYSFGFKIDNLAVVFVVSHFLCRSD